MTTGIFFVDLQRSYFAMFKLGTWKSKYPNIDVRHAGNVTGQRWKKDQFRNKKLLINWIESGTKIPGWGKTKELIKKLS